MTMRELRMSSVGYTELPFLWKNPICELHFSRALSSRGLILRWVMRSWWKSLWCIELYHGNALGDEFLNSFWGNLVIASKRSIAFWKQFQGAMQHNTDLGSRANSCWKESITSMCSVGLTSFFFCFHLLFSDKLSDIFELVLHPADEHGQRKYDSEHAHS